jgi:hypothetical protein
VAAQYGFRTVWRVAGTVDEVRDVLADRRPLPRWWPAVYLSVDTVTDGDATGRGGEIAPTTGGRWPRGEESLRLELRRRRAASDAERRRVPAPPPATFRWSIGRRHA